MAAAYAYPELDDEVEGRTDFADTTTSASVGEAVAAVARVLPRKWRGEVHFPEVAGFWVVLSHGVDAIGIKLEAMPHSATDFSFVGVFGREGLVDGGFNPAHDFEQCVKLICGALKGDMSMTVAFADDGANIHLIIRVPIVDGFDAHYKLPLGRIQLETGVMLPAKLKKVTTDCEAAIRQLATVQTEMEKVKAELAKEVADSGVANARREAVIAEKKKLIVDLKKQMNELRMQNSRVQRALKRATDDTEFANRQLEEAKREFQTAKREAEAASELAERQLADASLKIKRLSASLDKATSDGRIAAGLMTDGRTEMETRTTEAVVILEEMKELVADGSGMHTAATASWAFGWPFATRPSVTGTEPQLEGVLAELRSTVPRVATAMREADDERKAAMQDADDKRKTAELRLATMKSKMERKIEEMEALKMESETEIRIRDARISELERCRMVPPMAYVFDVRTIGDATDPRKFNVSADGKTATARMDWAQILMSPKLTVDGALHLRVDKIKGALAIGVTDDFRKGLVKTCYFSSGGDVYLNDAKVASSHAFGGWELGDWLRLQLDLRRGTVRIRSPHGEFTAFWKPRASPFWFALSCGYNGAGTKVTIE